ncbi:MAG: ATP-dependent RecD-like DNA helicase [Agitococcus sp.]|nr:ATP-dependent RecD-like DNA helicase [Agitococcus sp.]MDO9177064.1 ATP-dependent RecD-like DNA helicase [Agitococcus sp.]
MTKPDAALEQLSGVVKTLTFFSEESGYFVAKVTVDGNTERTVTGTAPSINVGEVLTAKGTWQSSKWGPQFKVKELTLSHPKMLADIEAYLAHSVNGIGKGYAKKLVAAFQENVFTVIEQTPEKLKNVPGIGKSRITAIVEAYETTQAIREIMFFLHRNGIAGTRAHRVHEKLGKNAIKKISHNPYILCNIWGIGFIIADGVAQKQGIAPDSTFRISAGIQHVLKQAEGYGSCGLPIVNVRDDTSALLLVDIALIEKVLQEEIAAKRIICDTVGDATCVFLPAIYEAEKAIAQILLRHDQAPLAPLKHDIPQIILEAQVDLGIELETMQEQAVHTALTSNITVITGGPGCGKTTITKVILEAFKEAGLVIMVLSAPTGKAAKRASQATGYQAKTIHRTLEVERDRSFKFNENNPLEADVWIIDEMSIVDVPLMHAACLALARGTRIILIGDVDQLPSVGPGRVLADIIDSGVLPTVRLTAIFRQGASSRIKVNAHAVNRGEAPEKGWVEGTDFCYTAILPKDSSDDAKRVCREKIEAEILRLAQDMWKLGFDPIKDVQILAPMRKGILGVDSLNTKLQKILNPNPSAFLEWSEKKWGVGDKVMQMRNNYDKNVFNGDIGYIATVDTIARVLTIEFDDGIVEYKLIELDELSLAYAFTIHKSQGSEFPVVIAPWDMSHYMMLKRNLLYTMMTRAKSLCILVANPQAVNIAVKTAQIDARYSRLKDWLQRGLA